MATRTAEQKAADDALTAAIEAVRDAYSDETGSREYLLTDYVVISAGTRFADDGESWSQVAMIYRDNDIPAYRILGLLDFALARARRYVAEDED